jgi:hypothetical protein
MGEESLKSKSSQPAAAPGICVYLFINDRALIVAIRSVTGWLRRKQWLPDLPFRNTNAIKRRSWRSLRSFDVDGRGIAEEQKIAACGSYRVIRPGLDNV